VAFSYLRFSDPKQRKGDSIRRQTAARDAWLKAHPDVPLDTSLKLTDRGKSAYHRKDWDAYALAKFIQEIEAGRVLPGDYLLVENLDRLSREVAGEALELFLSIVNRGVVIVQLLPQVLEFRRPVNTMSLMFAIVELSRGHSESEAKSFRSTGNWEKALRLARDEGGPMTRRLPAWVEIGEDGIPRLILERAAAIKRILALATAGYGMTRIVKQLNADGIHAFGDREQDEPDEDGSIHYRKVGGKPFGCGEWRTSYVRSILSDRRVLGELQPCDRDGKPKGDPIPGYYPPVVTEGEFYAARAAVLGRKNGGTANRQGRLGNDVANLFAGLLRNARDGSTYYAAIRVDRPRSDRPHGGKRPHPPANGKPYVTRVLRTQSGIEGRGHNHTFPYAVFERAVLSRLQELDPADVLGQDKPADVTVLQGELDYVKERRAKLAALLRGDDDVDELVAELRRLKDREAELLGQLDEAQERAAKPLEETWRVAQSLVGLLDGAAGEDREDRRLRLRAALRRMVDSVWLLVVPRGRDKVAAVQIRFEGGGRREYLVWHRGPQANQNGRDEGWYRLASIRSPFHGFFDPGARPSAWPPTTWPTPRGWPRWSSCCRWRMRTWRGTLRAALPTPCRDAGPGRPDKAPPRGGAFSCPTRPPLSRGGDT
jgi:DNA invertase Pin-like site-specific DNA recombinase